MTLLLEHFDTLLATPADVEHLNRAILTLAVQGRLTAQDPNDEPASELLNRIFDEKEKLAKLGKISIDDRLPKILDNEKPFELPSGWAWTRVGEICTIRGGKRVPNGSSLVDTPTKHIYIRVTEMKNGTLISANLKYITDDVYEQIKRYIIEKDDLYITIAGTIGAVGTVPDQFHEMNLTENAARITPYLLDKEFLKLALNSEFIQSQFLDKVNQMAQPKLALARIKTTLLPIPPLAEQKRIIARVETLFAQTRALAEKLTRAESDLEALNQSALFHLLSSESSSEFDKAWDFIAAHFESLFTAPQHIAPLRQSILELAVRGKLTRRQAGDEPARELLKRIKAEKEMKGKAEPLPPVKASEKPFALPDGWEWARFEELGVLERGKSKHRPRNAPFLFENGKYPFVQTGDVAQSKGRITKYSSMYSEQGLAQSKMWNKGTLCITIAANIAETGILEFNACFPDSVVGFVPNPIIGNVDYFQYFIKVAKNRLESYAPATAQKNINLGILQSLLIPLPPVNEITRIVAKVEQLLGLCDALESRLRAAQEERARLVESVLSGMSLRAVSSEATPS